jgi:membrane-associated phospholipid phosphatase
VFRTDFNHWAQSIDVTGFKELMQFISAVGSTYPVILICLIVLSGLHFRKGWILLNMIAFTTILTVFLKEVVDFPRPIAVDASLKAYGGDLTTINLTPLQPKDNWSFFSDELLLQTRQLDFGQQGLPSGHTSIHIAIWFGLAILFRKKWIWVTGSAMVLLMMISRTFLGVHYLGDVLGGLLLGLFSTGLAYAVSQLIEKNTPLRHYVFACLPAIFFLLPGSASSWQVFLILGINIAIAGIETTAGLIKLDASFKSKFFSAVTLIVLFIGIFMGTLSTRSILPEPVGNLLIGAGGALSLLLYYFIAAKASWVAKDRTFQ